GPVTAGAWRNTQRAFCPSASRYLESARGSVARGRTNVLLCALVAIVFFGCSSATPRWVAERPVTSEYKGCAISLTPSHQAELWRATVVIWPPEVPPETHPGINLRFSAASTNRKAVEEAAFATARQYIDGSLRQ